MKATNAKRILLAAALLWLVAWIAALGRDLSASALALAIGATVAYVLLGVWSERTRWIPLVLALVVMGFVAVVTAIAIPFVVGGLIAAAAILVPPDQPEHVFP